MDTDMAMLPDRKVDRSSPGRKCLGAAVAFALLCLGGLSPSAFAQTLEEGLRLYNRGDFDGAMKEWQPLANKGDADALFNLGQIHRLGRGMPINLPLAEAYYAKAAAAGHVTAQANLATIYYFNKGNAARQTEAIRLWGLAAAAGDGGSQYMLAVLHHNGDLVEKDSVMAYAWVLLAVDGGNEKAVQAAAIIGAGLSEAERSEARRLSYTLVSPVIAGMPPVMDAAPQPTPLSTTPAESRDAPPVIEDVPTEARTPPQVAPSAPTVSSNDTKGDYRSLDGRWRVQLGSFRDSNNANSHRASIEEKMGRQLAGLWWDLARLDLGADKGVYYRLLIGPLRDRAGSDTICDALKERGFDCFVVAP